MCLALSFPLSTPLSTSLVGFSCAKVHGALEKPSQWLISLNSCLLPLHVALIPWVNEILPRQLLLALCSALERNAWFWVASGLSWRLLRSRVFGSRAEIGPSLTVWISSFGVSQRRKNETDTRFWPRNYKGVSRGLKAKAIHLILCEDKGNNNILFSKNMQSSSV